jgi:hypothetical protein
MLHAAPTTPKQTGIIIAPPINMSYVTSADETLFMICTFFISHLIFRAKGTSVQ